MLSVEAYFKECERLATQLGQLLLEKKLSVSCVESCTGGLLASFLTSIAGSSAYFNQSWVTYSNEAKENLVGVSKTTLDAFGAVSEEVAIEMVLGCINMAKANIALSITGIAGPSGGTPTKPVGMVCFAVALNSEQLNANNSSKVNKPVIIAETKLFEGNRTHIRFEATLYAFKFLLQEIVKIS